MRKPRVSRQEYHFPKCFISLFHKISLRFNTHQRPPYPRKSNFYPLCHSSLVSSISLLSFPSTSLPFLSLGSDLNSEGSRTLSRKRSSAKCATTFCTMFPETRKIVVSGEANTIVTESLSVWIVARPLEHSSFIVGTAIILANNKMSRKKKKKKKNLIEKIKRETLIFFEI